MNMQKNFFDQDVLKTVYYNDKTKLSTRIDVWNKYGTSKISYLAFLTSIINSKTYNGYLDIGCGNAQYSSEFLKFVSGHAYFCDISEQLIEEAKIKVKDKALCSVRFINEDFSRAFIPPKSCELISLMHVLHHIDNVNLVLDKVEIIAKDNARILITTFDHSLNDFLNITHYEGLKKYNFPQYMIDKEQYLKFNGDNAYDLLKSRYPDRIEKYIFVNDARITDPNSLLEYYSSAMMFRLSKGYSSNDISKEQWQNLYSFVKNRVFTEIETNKEIVLEGHLIAFWIRAN